MVRVSRLLITPPWVWLLTVRRVSVPHDTARGRYSVTYLWDIPTPGVSPGRRPGVLRKRGFRAQPLPMSSMKLPS